MVKVKICGLTDTGEAELLNRYGADYAGIVLFYPESKRNVQIETAREIVCTLKPEIKKVAVMVSPTLMQARLCRQAGFDFLQVHGECRRELFLQGELPVFLAVHVGEEQKLSWAQPVQGKEQGNIAGYVFDGRVPGSGKTFDWRLLKDFDRSGRLLMLAGGLTPENVAEAVRCLHPDIVDVSSGVERESGFGKSPERIRRFIEEARKA